MDFHSGEARVLWVVTGADASDSRYEENQCGTWRSSMEIYNRRRLGPGASGAAVCESDAAKGPTTQDAEWCDVRCRINGGGVEDQEEPEHGTLSTTPSSPTPPCTDSVANRWKIRGRIYHRSHLHLLLVAAVLLTHMLVNIRIGEWHLFLHTGMIK
uniref:Uncharacterized protein n=1 Tax=Anopheles maculatus TaxID=74869 RepID=A0A182T288_9DIPT